MKHFVLFALVFLTLSAPYCAKAQIDPLKLSGEYVTSFGKFTIVVNNNHVTGWYEYYEQYDEKVKGYLRENVFFIKGTSINGKDFDIISTLPDFPGDIPKGKLSFFDKKLKIVLTDTPPLDCGFDISHESDKSYFPLVMSNTYLLLTFIKADKAHVYQLNSGGFTMRKAYLVKNEFVKVVAKKDGFSKILYQPIPEKKSLIYWIRDEDMLDPTADSWKGFIQPGVSK